MAANLALTRTQADTPLSRRRSAEPASGSQTGEGWAWRFVHAARKRKPGAFAHDRQSQFQRPRLRQEVLPPPQAASRCRQTTRHLARYDQAVISDHIGGRCLPSPSIYGRIFREKPCCYLQHAEHDVAGSNIVNTYIVNMRPCPCLASYQACSAETEEEIRWWSRNSSKLILCQVQRQAIEYF